MNSQSILVAVPTYNEAENIGDLIGGLRRHVPAATVLVVDDNSPDGTADLVEAIGRRDDQVRLLRRKGKLGLGTAHMAAFEYAQEHGIAIIVTMDADLSHRAEDAPKVIAEVTKPGVDVAVGSRYVRGGSIVGWTWKRRLLSASANRLIRSVLGIRTRDCTGAFRAYAVDFLSRADLSSARATGYSAIPELLHLLTCQGAVVHEVPITFVDRVRGVTKLDRRELGQSLRSLMRLRARRTQPVPLSLKSQGADWGSWG